MSLFSERSERSGISIKIMMGDDRAVKAVLVGGKPA
jgi:hypothetical protein